MPKQPLSDRMVMVRLPKEIETRLAMLAQHTGRTKTFYVREAILEHLDDLEDYYFAVSRLEEKLPAISLKEMEFRLGLDNQV